MPPYAGVIPVPTPETRPFWEAARRHQLVLPRCRACGRLHYHPRAACPFCLSGDLDWQPVSGRGRLTTFTVVHRGLPNFPLGVPYVLAIVELDEGPRMMTNLVGVEPDPARLRIGMRVEVAFADVSEQIALPHFRPVEESR
jgi:hypothetical protein